MHLRNGAVVAGSKLAVAVEKFANNRGVETRLPRLVDLLLNQTRLTRSREAQF